MSANSSSGAGSSSGRSGRRDPAPAVEASRRRARRLPTPPKVVQVSEDVGLVKALLGRIQGAWPQPQPQSQTYKEDPFEGYAKLFMTFAELGQQLGTRTLRELQADGLPEIVIQRSVADLHKRTESLHCFFEVFGQVLRGGDDESGSGMGRAPVRVSAVYEGIRAFFRAYEGYDCELGEGNTKLQNCIPALLPALHSVQSGWDVWVQQQQGQHNE